MAADAEARSDGCRDTVPASGSSAVTDPPDPVAEAHWNEEAKPLLTDLILFIAAPEAPERRTLAALRELLTLPADRFDDLL